MIAKTSKFRTVNGAIALVVAAGFSGVAGAQSTGAVTDITGIWIDHTGQGAVEIAPCRGVATRVCGYVVWMKNAIDAKGRPLTDHRNPDPVKRKQSMCGTQIIGELARAAGGAWGTGWIYNPEDGDRFDVEVRLKAPDVLTVHGYMGLKFLGETFTWRRAPAGLAKCQAG